MKNNFMKKASLFSLSSLLVGVASVSSVMALEIIANNYEMNATAEKMSAQQVCESAGLVKTDPTENVTWTCSSGNLDTTKEGMYSINIEAKDNESGDTAEKTIRIRVKAVATNSAPVIVLKQSEVKIKRGDSISLKSYATAMDEEDGDLTNSIKISGSVDTDKVGTYTITYTVSDSKGLEASATLTVIVEEKASEDVGGSDSKEDNKGSENDKKDDNTDKPNSGNSGNSGNSNTGNSNSGNSNSNKPTLPDTADNTAYILGGMATVALGGIAVLKKKKEIAE